MVGATTLLFDQLHCATETRDPCATIPAPRGSGPQPEGAPGLSMRATTTMPRGETAELSSSSGCARWSMSERPGARQHLAIVAPAAVLERLR
jgi:hypothetical protein